MEADRAMKEVVRVPNHTVEHDTETVYVCDYCGREAEDPVRLFEDPWAALIEHDRRMRRIDIRARAGPDSFESNAGNTLTTDVTGLTAYERRLSPRTDPHGIAHNYGFDFGCEAVIHLCRECRDRTFTIDRETADDSNE